MADMGYIKEPYGIDFVVDPTPLTDGDRKMISAVIEYYKATGRKKCKNISCKALVAYAKTEKLPRRAAFQSL